MAADRKLLLNTLKNLKKDEVKEFKWLLQQQDFQPIPACQLANEEITDIVDAMVKHYNKQAVDAAINVFTEMKNYEQVEELKGKKDVPAPQVSVDIESLKCKLQSNLKHKFQFPINNIFTPLYITVGGDVHIIKEHEILQIGMSPVNPGDTEYSVKPEDIFKDPAGNAVRTVMTTGHAGIGKTMLVNKFVLDWAEKRHNQDVQLLFHFTFRKLNLWKRQKLSLAQLIHKSMYETIFMTEDQLNHIFTELQNSGNSSFDESQFKLLFVFDGLDENRLQLDMTADDTQHVDNNDGLTKPVPLEQLLRDLMKGSLLPSARLWITTRPAAAHQVPGRFVSLTIEVRGFDDPQKEEYFRKRFPNKASTIVSHIKSSRSLYIMCYLPIFCFIASTVLEDVLKKKRQLPKTLTEMYTEFLMFQINESKRRDPSNKTIQDIQSLAKLAYHKLLVRKYFFYTDDTKGSGVNFQKASLYSGIFTESFKAERRQKNEGKTFSFIHPSVQEYLAAFHVITSLINHNKNVICEWAPSLGSLLMLCKTKQMADLHRNAIDKALESEDGHLDLFLRFLLGLSLKNNQDTIEALLKKPRTDYSETNSDTIEYIKSKLRKDEDQVRSINLLYCLKELEDNSLEEEVQHLLKHESFVQNRISPDLWTTLVFFLLSSESEREVFDLKKYSPSEEGLIRLQKVIKMSTKSLLSSCNLSSRIGFTVASFISSQPSNLRELDLSDNELMDTGVVRLSAGLAKHSCTLQVLKLSGCYIREDGCAALATALSSNPSHLRELDLSYNHPGASGVKLLTAGLEDLNWTLVKLCFDHCGENRMLPGVKKYICKLSLDQNTAHRNLKLSDNKTVTTVRQKQPYPDQPQRFTDWVQLLCSSGLTSRSYWEVTWEGMVYVAVTYAGIQRKGDGANGCFGHNDVSWALLCDDENCYSVWHKGNLTFIHSSSSATCNRVAVYLNYQAGTLSFYSVYSGRLIHLHTFTSTFTEPLYPAFGFRSEDGCFGSSVTLCDV